MNDKQAKAALKKLYGSKAAWRYDERAPKADERAEIVASLPDLSTAYTDAKAARDARRAELLRDPEYLRLCEVADVAQKAHGKALSKSHHYRVTVGTISNGAGLSFFSVKAEGDNWQDAIDKARAKAEKS